MRLFKKKELFIKSINITLCTVYTMKKTLLHNKDTKTQKLLFEQPHIFI